jgi:hypothetical protein
LPPAVVQVPPENDPPPGPLVVACADPEDDPPTAGVLVRVGDEVEVLPADAPLAAGVV